MNLPQHLHGSPWIILSLIFLYVAIAVWDAKTKK